MFKWHDIGGDPPPPQNIQDIVNSMTPPRLGDHVIRSATIDAKRIILVYFENPTGIATKFIILPNPEAS